MSMPRLSKHHTALTKELFKVCMMDHVLISRVVSFRKSVNGYTNFSTLLEDKKNKLKGKNKFPLFTEEEAIYFGLELPFEEIPLWISSRNYALDIVLKYRLKYKV